jgi:hypothetical protein
MNRCGSFGVSHSVFHKITFKFIQIALPDFSESFLNLHVVTFASAMPI